MWLASTASKLASGNGSSEVSATWPATRPQWPIARTRSTASATIPADRSVNWSHKLGFTNGVASAQNQPGPQPTSSTLPAWGQSGWAANQADQSPPPYLVWRLARAVRRVELAYWTPSRYLGSRHSSQSSGLVTVLCHGTDRRNYEFADTRQWPQTTCAVTRRRFSSGCNPHPATAPA